jgi:hypothetical protein
MVEVENTPGKVGKTGGFRQCGGISGITGF